MPKSTRFFPALFFIVALPFLLFSQQPPVDHLRMDLRFADSILAVDAHYAARMKETDNTMLLLLNPGYDIQQITAPDLDTFQLTQVPNRPVPFWKLTFDRELKAGETVVVRFVYNIDLVGQNHLNSDWIELNTDKLWSPNQGDFDNDLTYEVTVAGLPPDFKLVSYMDAKVETEDSGHIVIRKEDPAKEVLILAGRNMQFWKAADTSEITFFAHEETPDSLLLSMNDKVAKSIELMTRTFGSAKPIKTYRVVLRNTPRTELGFQYSRENMIITGPDFNSFGNLSHEIAHYWWGGADFIEEPWMNESFANYSMFLVMEAYDPAGYERIFEKYREIAGEAPPVGQATLFSENAYDAYYIKGSILLKELEGMIGKAKMMELLTVRVEKNIDSTEGFLRELERIADRETRERFEGMLRE